MLSVRNYIDLVEGIFSRSPTIVRPTVPIAQGPTVAQALANAKQYNSAEEYALDNNPVVYLRTDPPHLRDKSEREHSRLVSQWQNWKHLGLI
jgi:hypothetical protein